MSTVSRDPRVMRQVKALQGRYHVTTVGYGLSPDGVEEHISIPKSYTRHPISLSALAPHSIGCFETSSGKIPAVSFAKKHLEKSRPDFVILNDASSLPVAESVKVPCLVDMHEYAPREMEEDWRFRLLLMRYYRWLCAKYLPQASIVTTVSHSLAEMYFQDFAVKPHVIMNTCEYRDIKIRESKLKEIRLVHTGLASKARGLDVTITAVSGLKNVLLDLYLVSAPYQAKEMKRLQNLAARSPNVRILPPVSRSQLPVIMNNYDLTILCRPNSIQNNRVSMPNKLFESIQARVGIVTSPNGEIERFCRDTGTGVAIGEYSAPSLRRTIETITAERIHEFKVACDSHAREFSAESEAAKLRALVGQIT